MGVALTFGSDRDVRTRPLKYGSFGDRLNKEKRGLSVRTKEKWGGGSFGEDYTKERDLLVNPSVFRKKGVIW